MVVKLGCLIDFLYLGSPGLILEPKDEVWRIQFSDGNILNIGSSLLKKIDDNPSEFRKGDLVVVAKSKTVVMHESEKHGGWNEKMILNLNEKAVVLEVLDNGTVVVKGVNTLRWALSPNVLTKIDEPKDVVKDEALVCIINDLAKLRQIQNNYGSWTELMEKILGELGIVKEILPNGMFVVETGIGKNKYHRTAFKFVASHDEMIKGIVLRQQYEQAQRRSVVGCIIS